MSIIAGVMLTTLRTSAPNTSRTAPTPPVIRSVVIILMKTYFPYLSQGVSVTAMDDILYSRTVQDCERFCDDVSTAIFPPLYLPVILKIFQARAFNCRSFSQKGDRCYLSGDDSVTLPDSTQPQESVGPGRALSSNLTRLPQGSSYKEKVCTRSTCDGGMFTYEKTTAHFLRTAR